MEDPFLGMNPSFLRFIKHMRMGSSLDELQWVFVTLFELVKMKKRHSSIMMGELREGNYLICNKWQLLVTFEHGTCLHFIQSIGYWDCFPSQSTFMNHVTPLILSRNASSTVALCFNIFLVKLMLPSLWSCHPMFKGNSCWEFASTVKILCQIPLSHSYCYIILKIP